MTRILFICGKNRLRSPTAEQVFATWPGVETDSAGINHDADVPVSAEQLAWADLVFVMESTHQTKLRQRFRGDLRAARVICLGIPDDYGFMDPALVERLLERVSPYLPSS
jgi:predicted protein tyrosine phosphatase